MSCLKSESISSDSSLVSQDRPVIESNEQYTELVQKSYENLFGPWLKSDESETDQYDGHDPASSPNSN